MKRIYMTPEIRLQSVDAEDIMETTSLPVFEDKTASDGDYIITNGSEVLGNSNSVWEE